jgi:predicted CXXCH cytochrome family protein
MLSQEFFIGEQTREKGNCSYCHLSFETAGHKIWKKVPESMQEYGAVSLFCYACHDGLTIVDKNVDASLTAYSEKSHSFFQRRIADGISEQNVSLTFLEGKPLDCTTCHTPHDNEHRPFLVVPLNELCQQCHVIRRNSGYNKNNAESNHPVFTPLSDSTEGPSPIKAAEIFKVEFPLPYPTAGGKFSKGTHWDLGGHLSEGQGGNMECYTCHSVHGDEQVGPNDKLMAIDPVREVNDVFCESCHQGKRGDGDELSLILPNPGGTKGERTYHPVDDETSKAPGEVVDISVPKDWPVGKGAGEGNLLCSTCHDVHEGLKNSPILRVPEGDTFCEECHDEKPEGHHSSGKESNPKNVTFATTGYNWSYEIESQWENGNPIILLEEDPESDAGGYGGYGTTYGEKVENKVYCSSCHRAHNAGSGVEKKAAPSLIVSHTANQLCFMCHAATNVAFNTDLTKTASHFLGDPTRDDTYQKPLDEMILKEDNWVETRLKSKYGGDNEREIICESCHSFSKDNLNAKKYSYAYNNEAMLVARADEHTDWIPGTSEVVTDDDDYDYFSDSDTVGTDLAADGYLCVGCHGENPGGGGSHPMMGIDGVMPNGEKVDRTQPTPPATYSLNLNINCLTCHNIHRGEVKGGVYMLKAATRENEDPLAIHPNVEYTVLCGLCHPR